jgi:hypothetical protein
MSIRNSLVVNDEFRNALRMKMTGEATEEPTWEQKTALATALGFRPAGVQAWLNGHTKHLRLVNFAVVYLHMGRELEECGYEVEPDIIIKALKMLAVVGAEARVNERLERYGLLNEPVQAGGPGEPSEDEEPEAPEEELTGDPLEPEASEPLPTIDERVSIRCACGTPGLLDGFEYNGELTLKVKPCPKCQHLDLLPKNKTLRVENEQLKAELDKFEGDINKLARRRAVAMLRASAACYGDEPAEGDEEPEADPVTGLADMPPQLGPQGVPA